MQGTDALHFRPGQFDKISSISLVKSDEKIHPENPPSLRPNPSARGDASLWDMGPPSFSHNYSPF